MRRSHFDSLRPVCPHCLATQGASSPLTLAVVEREEAGHVIEGIIHCSDPRCFLEYPIIDGIPCLVPNVRQFLSDNLLQWSMREDLGAAIESMLGDSCGPGSVFDALRQQLSIYGFAHFSDLDPGETEAPEAGDSVLDGLRVGLELFPHVPQGPVLDIGCSVGRASFALAQTTGGLTLGIDLNVAMLRLAHRVLRQGLVLYPRRRIGVAYDRRTFAVDLPGADQVDFWACDALALPFQPETFRLTAALNVLDCIHSPRDLLAGMSRCASPGGDLLLTTPYDWSAATPMECWIGGHSQRGPTRGEAEPFLQDLLREGAHPQSLSGVSVLGEALATPWQLRLHQRSRVSYLSHLLALRVAGQGPEDPGALPAA
jgi:SAM-dependent methyltransferase/uncharacterized protein YbaR (Trm112 family)